MNETWTLPGQIARLALERPDRKALIEMGPDGDWVSTNWGEYWQAVRDFAKGLISLGMQSGESVTLIGVRRQSIWHRLNLFLRDTFLPVLSPV